MADTNEDGTELVVQPQTQEIEKEEEKEKEEEPRTNISGSAPSDAFNEAIKDLQNNNGTTFNQCLVTAARRGFEVILWWFALLLLSWDICIPIASIKAAFWTSEDQVYCQGASCDLNCQELANQTYVEDCKPEPRIYGDTPLFFNPQFRQELGNWWVVFISFHVFAAWFAFPTYFTQLFCTFPGKKVHKCLGIFILVIVLVLWTFGGLAAVILCTVRGFHPCAYSVIDYNNPNPYYTNNGENTASSFPFYLYLQFAYDGALLNECLMHGIAARLLVAMAFDPNYQYVGQPGSILRKWQAGILAFLSGSSLWLYVWRTMTMIVIVIIYYSKTDEEQEDLDTVWNVKVKGYVENQCVLDGDMTVNYPNVSQTLDAITTVSTATQKMCISRGDENPAYAQEEQVVIMMFLFIAQLLIIPMINIPNLLKYSKWFYDSIELHDTIQQMTDKEKIKEKINETLYFAKSAHGSNLTVAGFVVLWTFTANVGYVFAEFLIAVSYVGGIIALMMWWYCKCQVVKPCPWPYNLCCCKCCSQPQCGGMVSCEELCACLIPPDENRSLADILKARFPTFGGGDLYSNQK